MAITRVRSTGKGHSSGSFLQVSFAALPAAGNLIVVEAISYGNVAAITAADFSDNQGNTYQIAAAAAPNSGSATILYAQNIGSPSGTFTITWNPVPSGASYLVMCGVEWSGLATSSVLDRSVTATGNNNAPTVSTGTTAQANELIVAVGYNDDQGANQPFTKDTLFTEDFIEQDATQYIVGEGSYRIVSSIGNYTSIWTTNAAPWSAAIASFKMAGGAPAGPIIGTTSLSITPSATLITHVDQFNLYDQAAADIMNGTIDLLTATIKVMLVTSTYVPDPSHLVVDAGGANDPVDAEIVATGYTRGWNNSGRKTLTGKTVATNSTLHRGVFDASDTIWATLGGATNATISGALLIVEGGANDTTSRLLGYYALTPLTTSGVGLRVQWDTNGVLFW